MNRSPVGDRGDAAAEALAALVLAERDDGDRDGERTGDIDVLLRAFAVGSNVDDDDMPALRADFEGLCGGEAPRSVMNMVGLVVGTEEGEGGGEWSDR